MKQRDQDRGTENHGDGILCQRNHPAKGNGAGHFLHRTLTAADAVEHQHGRKHERNQTSGKASP